MKPPAAAAAPGTGWFGQLFVGLSITCSAAATSAQALNVVRDDADEKLIACLSPAASALPPIVYPADALLLKQDATVRVRLTFTRPDAPPEAAVFFNSGDDRFSELVLRRVKAYRMPCLPSGRSSVVATQEFYFDPRDGRPVVWNASRPEMSAAVPNACAQQATGTVDYPRRALDRDTTRSAITRESQSGVVLVRMRATSEGPPATVSILSNAGSRLLADAVTEYLQTTRVRCDSYPADILQTFHFRIEGETQYALKDLPLKSFVGLVKDIDRQTVRFDFSTMGCPFDVQLKLYQPYFPNDAEEVGAANSNRADFLTWLSGVTLRLPTDAAKHLLGAQTRISVPCGLLDLRE